jgi:dual specificity phosphatase 12
MNWVIPGKLAVGDMNAASDIEMLKKNNIKAIVTARGRLSHRRKYYNNHGIQVLHVPIADHHEINIGKYFPAVFNFIEKYVNENYGVLVHCAAGISRSVTLTLSYIMRKYNLSTAQAINYLERIRPCINPNPGFLKQLRDYEQLLKKNTNPFFTSFHSTYPLSNPSHKTFTLVKKKCYSQQQ